MTTHNYYMPRLYRFIEELAANNNRPWFDAHKSEYQDLRTHWMADLDAMISHIRQWLPEVGSQTAASSAYRIYRDIRFSPDKTPFKTHFSAAIVPGGKKSPYAGFYISTGMPKMHYQGLFGGLWCPDAKILSKMRHAIVDNIEEWEQIVTDPQLTAIYEPDCSSLKTIPKGWDRNHPYAKYLRLTNYGYASEKNNKYFLDPAWPEHAAADLHRLLPFINFLNYTINE